MIRLSRANLMSLLGSSRYSSSPLLCCEKVFAPFQISSFLFLDFKVSAHDTNVILLSTLKKQFLETWGGAQFRMNSETKNAMRELNYKIKIHFILRKKYSLVDECNQRRNVNQFRRIYRLQINANMLHECLRLAFWGTKGSCSWVQLSTNWDLKVSLLFWQSIHEDFSLADWQHL